MSHSRQEKIEAIGRVIDTLERLRVECPWDRKQTNQSLRPNTIEETYELCEALLNEDNANICKELGDVLLHILFYAKIGEEKGAFDIGDVATSLNNKLIFRHPHVFGEAKAADSHAVEQRWEEIKLKEKGGNRTVLAGVPSSLPALIKAYRIQEKAANSGFDWAEASEVWDKVREEIGEFSAEAEKVRMLRHQAEATPEEISAASERMESEMGDVFFSLVNAARLYGVIPENALEKTNKKFISRFNHIEKRAREAGRKLNELTLEEMEEYWQEAKDKS